MSHYIMTPQGFVGRRIRYTDDYTQAKEFESLQEASLWGTQAAFNTWTTVSKPRAEVTTAALRALLCEQRTAFIG